MNYSLIALRLTELRELTLNALSGDSNALNNLDGLIAAFQEEISNEPPPSSEASATETIEEKKSGTDPLFGSDVRVENRMNFNSDTESFIQTFQQSLTPPGGKNSSKLRNHIDNDVGKASYGKKFDPSESNPTNFDVFNHLFPSLPSLRSDSSTEHHLYKSHPSPDPDQGKYPPISFRNGRGKFQNLNSDSFVVPPVSSLNDNVQHPSVHFEAGGMDHTPLVDKAFLPSAQSQGADNVRAKSFEPIFVRSSLSNYDSSTIRSTHDAPFFNSLTIDASKIATIASQKAATAAEIARRASSRAQTQSSLHKGAPLLVDTAGIPTTTQNIERGTPSSVLSHSAPPVCTASKSMFMSESSLSFSPLKGVSDSSTREEYSKQPRTPLNVSSNSNNIVLRQSCDEGLSTATVPNSTENSSHQFDNFSSSSLGFSSSGLYRDNGDGGAIRSSEPGTIRSNIEQFSHSSDTFIDSREVYDESSALEQSLEAKSGRDFTEEDDHFSTTNAYCDSSRKSGVRGEYSRNHFPFSKLDSRVPFSYPDGFDSVSRHRYNRDVSNTRGLSRSQRESYPLRSLDHRNLDTDVDMDTGVSMRLRSDGVVIHDLDSTYLGSEMDEGSDLGLGIGVDDEDLGAADKAGAPSLSAGSGGVSGDNSSSAAFRLKRFTSGEDFASEPSFHSESEFNEEKAAFSDNEEAISRRVQASSACSMTSDDSLKRRPRAFTEKRQPQLSSKFGSRRSEVESITSDESDGLDLDGPMSPLVRPNSLTPQVPFFTASDFSSTNALGEPFTNHFSNKGNSSVAGRFPLSRAGENISHLRLSGDHNKLDSKKSKTAYVDFHSAIKSNEFPARTRYETSSMIGREKTGCLDSRKMETVRFALQMKELQAGADMGAPERLSTVNTSSNADLDRTVLNQPMSGLHDSNENVGRRHSQWYSGGHETDAPSDLGSANFDTNSYEDSSIRVELPEARSSYGLPHDVPGRYLGLDHSSFGMNSLHGGTASTSITPAFSEASLSWSPSAVALQHPQSASGTSICTLPRTSVGEESGDSVEGTSTHVVASASCTGLSQEGHDVYREHLVDRVSAGMDKPASLDYTTGSPIPSEEIRRQNWNSNSSGGSESNFGLDPGLTSYLRRIIAQDSASLPEQFFPSSRAVLRALKRSPLSDAHASSESHFTISRDSTGAVGGASQTSSVGAKVPRFFTRSKSRMKGRRKGRFSRFGQGLNGEKRVGVSFSLARNDYHETLVSPTQRKTQERQYGDSAAQDASDSLSTQALRSPNSPMLSHQGNRYTVRANSQSRNRAGKYGLGDKISRSLSVEGIPDSDYEQQLARLRRANQDLHPDEPSAHRVHSSASSVQVVEDREDDSSRPSAGIDSPGEGSRIFHSAFGAGLDAELKEKFGAHFSLFDSDQDTRIRVVSRDLPQQDLLNPLEFSKIRSFLRNQQKIDFSGIKEYAGSEAESVQAVASVGNRYSHKQGRIVDASALGPAPSGYGLRHVIAKVKQEDLWNSRSVGSSSSSSSVLDADSGAPELSNASQAGSLSASQASMIASNCATNDTDRRPRLDYPVIDRDKTQFVSANSTDEVAPGRSIRSDFQFSEDEGISQVVDSDSIQAVTGSVNNGERRLFRVSSGLSGSATAAAPYADTDTDLLEEDHEFDLEFDADADVSDSASRRHKQTRIDSQISVVATDGGLSSAQPRYDAGFIPASSWSSSSFDRKTSNSSVFVQNSISPAVSDDFAPFEAHRAHATVDLTSLDTSPSVSLTLNSATLSNNGSSQLRNDSLPNQVPTPSGTPTLGSSVRALSDSAAVPASAPVPLRDLPMAGTPEALNEKEKIGDISTVPRPSVTSDMLLRVSAPPESVRVVPSSSLAGGSDNGSHSDSDSDSYGFHSHPQPRRRPGSARPTRPILQASTLPLGSRATNSFRVNDATSLMNESQRVRPPPIPRPHSFPKPLSRQQQLRQQLRRQQASHGVFDSDSDSDSGAHLTPVAASRDVNNSSGFEQSVPLSSTAVPQQPPRAQNVASRGLDLRDEEKRAGLGRNRTDFRDVFLALSSGDIWDSTRPMRRSVASASLPGTQIRSFARRELAGRIEYGSGPQISQGRGSGPSDFRKRDSTGSSSLSQHGNVQHTSFSSNRDSQLFDIDLPVFPSISDQSIRKRRKHHSASGLPRIRASVATEAPLFSAEEEPRGDNENQAESLVSVSNLALTPGPHVLARAGSAHAPSAVSTHSFQSGRKSRQVWSASSAVRRNKGHERASDDAGWIEGINL